MSIAEDINAAVVITDRDPRAWAHRLKAREVSGHRLTPAQREAWRAALREVYETAPEIGQVRPINAAAAQVALKTRRKMRPTKK